MLIGYARVSTVDQNLALQRDALTEAGCTKIFTEQMSGAVTDRPAFRDALEFARSGDTLIVWKLDRLARSGRFRRSPPCENFDLLARRLRPIPLPASPIAG
jgi:DNA invertase Pin-like site-specific DNA recombinase